MQYKTIYFSPTYSTQKIVRLIAQEFEVDAEEIDITNFKAGDGALVFGEDDFVVLGIPVYSGRVPRLAKTIISEMRGSNTPIALVATYGNRDYDDALLELKETVQQHGFMVVGAAAFVTEHSVVRKFGAGRPDAEDKKIICQYANQLKTAMGAWDSQKHQDVMVKGNSNYREYKTIPVKPHTTSSCVECGACAVSCPAGAIPLDNPKKTDKKKCVTCMRCAYICPKGARKLSAIANFLAEKGLKKVCEEYKHPEIFT